MMLHNPACDCVPRSLRLLADRRVATPGLRSLGRRLVSQSPSAFAAAVAILLLSACADKPPIVSADTSCERFRHISATPAQIKVYQDNWEVMETYADQVVSHNLEYDRLCIDPPPGARK